MGDVQKVNSRNKTWGQTLDKVCEYITKAFTVTFHDNVLI